MSEVSGAFAWRDRFEDSTDRPVQTLDGTSGSFAKQSLDFGKSLLDGIEVGTVGWKVAKFCACGFDGFLNTTDAPLPPRYFDHPLGGEWKDHRDCHIRPDLIMIYRKPDAGTLQLVRLGSHSELGL